MGWGWIPTAKTQAIDGPHVDDPPENFSSQDFWRWVQEATSWNIFSGDANPLANSHAVANRSRWSSAGLPNFYDVSARSADRSLRFSVRLRRPGPEGIRVTTRSAAETYFYRPDERSDGAVELSNLFHPFWQARLSQAAAVEELP